MDPLLESAQKSLKIRSVVLRSSLVNINEDIEPSELSKVNCTTQNYRGVSRVQEAKYEDEKREWWEYSFYYSVGVRLIKEEDDVSPLVEIKAVFSAVYFADNALTEEQIKAFSLNNAGYHVWPYWRELMQSSCTRLQIEPIEAPLYFCPRK